MKIEADKDDAEEFVEIVNKLMSRTIFQWGIDEIMNIKIKNWFDHKWLNYSGKKIIHFENTQHPDKIALTHDWKKRITFPPFNPNRVLSEQFFRKRPTGNRQFEKVLHKQQRSTDNQLNLVSNKTKNGLYVWYSSNSHVNGQGSLMMYRVDNEKVETWYASIVKKDGWKIGQTKGIGKNELQSMLEIEA